MKELQQILERYKCYDTRQVCLATVVQTQGSSYRRPGARMLIVDGAQAAGAISGGCLETDVIDQAGLAWAQNQSRVITYDTRPAEDIVLGTGLGCQGVMDILIEPICYGNTCVAHLRFVEKLFRNRSTGVVATIIRQIGSINCSVGDRLMLDETGKLSGFLADGVLSQSIVNAMIDVMDGGPSATRRFPSLAGWVEVFLEFVQPPSQFVIFGAGHDAMPLARMAKEIGFTVVVVDHRESFVNCARFPEADIVMVSRPETFDLELPLDQRTTAVIMSHNYLMDQSWLQRLLPAGLGYLGLMGPKKRAEKMLFELRAQGIEFTENCFANFHNPVGLDIGADSAEQIALSILGEIQAVLSGHGGGMLCHKRAAIHSQAELAPRETSEAAAEKIICLASA